MRLPCASLLQMLLAPRPCLLQFGSLLLAAVALCWLRQAARADPAAGRQRTRLPYSLLLQMLLAPQPCPLQFETLLPAVVALRWLKQGAMMGSVATRPYPCLSLPDSRLQGPAAAAAETARHSEECRVLQGWDCHCHRRHQT